MSGEARLRSPRRALVLALALVIVVGGSTGAWAISRRSTATTAATQLVAATTGTMKQTVSATGTVEPQQQANLQFGQTGKVTAVDVQVGQQVTAGSTLATLDPSSLQSAVTLAQAQLMAAQAQLTAADTAGNAAQIASANAQVTSAQGRLTSAQQALAQASLTTPLTGTVAAVNIVPGDQVTGASTGSASSSGSGPASSSSSGSGSGGPDSSGSGSSGPGASSVNSSASSAQVVVISTTSWLVDASVGASDLPSLKTGMQATITAVGAADPVFGTVSTIGVLGTTSGGTSTFPVTIAVTGRPSGLYAGSTATVLITVKQLPDVLTVPTQAIHVDNGQTVVYQMRNGQQVSTPVTVGTVSGATTEITQGLHDGDQVVLAARPTTNRGTGTRTGSDGSGAGGGGAPGGGGLGGGGLGGSGTGRTGGGTGSRG